jgi:hypothetical protein
VRRQSSSRGTKDEVVHRRSGANSLTRADFAATLLDVVADDSMVRQAIEVTVSRHRA